MAVGKATENAHTIPAPPPPPEKVEVANNGFHVEDPADLDVSVNFSMHITWLTWCLQGI
jgi:hypothetical protein